MGFERSRIMNREFNRRRNFIRRRNVIRRVDARSVCIGRSFLGTSLVRLAGCASLLMLTGCGLFQPSQLSQCQADKKQVMSKVVSQQRQIDELQTERKRLSDRLAEAEKQLAVVHDQAPNLVAEGRRPTSNSSDVPSRSSSRESTRESSRDSSRESTRDANAPNQWAPRQRRQ